MALLLAARAAGAGNGRSWEATLVRDTERTVLQGADDRTVPLASKDIGGMQLANTGSRPVFAEFDIQGTAVQPPAPRADIIRFAAAVVPAGWHGRGTAARCRPATCWWHGYARKPARPSPTA